MSETLLCDKGHSAVDKSLGQLYFFFPSSSLRAVRATLASSLYRSRVRKRIKKRQEDEERKTNKTDQCGHCIRSDLETLRECKSPDGKSNRLCKSKSSPGIRRGLNSKEDDAAQTLSHKDYKQGMVFHRKAKSLTMELFCLDWSVTNAQALLQRGAPARFSTTDRNLFSTC